MMLPSAIPNDKHTYMRRYLDEAIEFNRFSAGCCSLHHFMQLRCHRTDMLCCCYVVVVASTINISPSTIYLTKLAGYCHNNIKNTHQIQWSSRNIIKHRSSYFIYCIVAAVVIILRIVIKSYINWR